MNGTTTLGGKKTSEPEFQCLKQRHIKENAMHSHLGTRRDKTMQLIAPLMLAACGGSKTSENVAEVNKLEGSPNSDYIQASEDDELITALSGDDRIYADGGDDQIFPGPGSDIVYAGEGDDKIIIEDLGDYVDGGAGIDTLTIVGSLLTEPISIDFRTGIIEAGDSIFAPRTEFGSVENFEANNLTQFTIQTGQDDNIISTGPADDILYLSGGNDTVATSDGADAVTILTGSHNLSLGDGNDFVTFTSGSHTIDGGTGNDTLEFNASNQTRLKVDVSEGELRSTTEVFGHFEQIEKYSIGGSPVTFTGTEQSETFTGSDYDDEFNGGGGFDTYQGNGGSDLFNISTNEQSYTTIMDLDILGDQDVIQISGAGVNVTSNGESIFTVDVSIAGPKVITSQGSIFRVISETGFDTEQQVLLAIIGSNGIITPSAIILQNAKVVTIWYDQSSGASKISLLQDQNSNGTLDFISTIATLENISQQDLTEITSDSFVIA